MKCSREKREKCKKLYRPCPAPWGAACPRSRTGGFSNAVGSTESRRALARVPPAAFIAAALAKGAEANTNMIPQLTVLSSGGERAGLGNGDQWGALGER